MTGGITGFQKAYKVSEAVPQYRGVIFDKEDFCKLPTADNQVPLGVVFNDEQLRVGMPVSVAFDRYVEIEAEGTITAGDEIILATGGTCLNTSGLVAGTAANLLGYAENSGVKGDIITVRVERKVVIK